jgi:hypothetical protein
MSRRGVRRPSSGAVIVQAPAPGGEERIGVGSIAALAGLPQQSRDISLDLIAPGDNPALERQARVS